MTEHYLTAVSRSHRRPLEERVRRYRAWLASSRSCCGHPGPALNRKRTARGAEATCMVCGTEWIER